MNGKKWIKAWVIIMITIVAPIVVVFNYLVDPMWIYQHSYDFNNKQDGFDERVQKTNYLKNNRDKFDSLLIGSSRTTYYNQNEFKNMKVFNYAFAGGKAYEYMDFINYYKKNSKMKYLIIGIDFSNSTNKGGNRSQKNKKLLDNIDNMNPIIYFIKNYLSLDTIKNSIVNLINYMVNNKAGHMTYNRNNIVSVSKVKENAVEKIALKRSKNYYNSTPSYNNISKSLDKIKDNNPNTKIIIYTTPLSKPFLDYIFNNQKLKKYYFMWIKDLVNSFDKIYFTTYYSHLSLNYKLHSKDGDHFYPYVGKEITQFISGGKQDTSTINIANNILEINKNNINKILENLKTQIQNYNLNKTLK